jgi:hypothetical protein
MELAIAATVLSGVAQMAGASQQSAAYKAEKAQYQEEAATARVAAKQDEAQRRTELNRTLSVQQAIRAGRGVDIYSGSGANITRQTKEAAETDILTSKINFGTAAQRYDLGATAAGKKAKGAMIGGAAGLLSSAGTAAYMGK